MEWIVEELGAVEMGTIDKLASELVVEAVVPRAELRGEIARRFRYDAAGDEPPRKRKRGVVPV